MTNTLNPVPVVIDGGAVMHGTAAWVSPHRWNGWVMPYFTRDEGMPLIAQTEALLAQYGPEAASVLAWDDARGVFTETDEEGTYDVPTREVDGVTLHGIGAACWTWELATP